MSLSLSIQGTFPPLKLGKLSNTALEIVKQDAQTAMHVEILIATDSERENKEPLVIGSTKEVGAS